MNINYIITFIIGAAIGFFVSKFFGNSGVNKDGQSKKIETFAERSPAEMKEIRAESKEALSERTQERKEEILEFMRGEIKRQKELRDCNLVNPKKGTTCEDVEKLLEVTGQTARKYLDELEDEGQIKQVGKTGKGVYYELIP